MKTKDAWKVFNSITDGSFFSVRFIKRTTGEERKMLCRKRVKKGLRGGEMAYDPKPKNLLVVWDVQKEGYRTISVDSVLEIKEHGETHS